jgi:hypothetical protein
MDNRILGLIAMMLVMSPALAAVSVTLDKDYACSSNSDTFTVTATGLGGSNVTNFTYDGALGTTSTVGLTACTTGTYTNASYATTTAGGALTCTARVYGAAHGTHTLALTDAVGSTSSDTYTAKCYGVSDLVSQGVDIAGNFMNALVGQSGNIAMLVILGLIVTLLVGVIAAVGTIFYVFKLK